jgi:ribosomal protein L29
MGYGRYADNEELAKHYAGGKAELAELRARREARDAQPVKQVAATDGAKKLLGVK